MRGAWVGALGGAVLAGAGAGYAGIRRSRSRHAADEPDPPGELEESGRAEQSSRSERSSRSDPSFDTFPPWLDGPAIPVITSDGLRLHAEVAGRPDAPITIVFVHGYGLNRRSWRFQRRDLAEDARLVFYDQRSHGASARSTAEACTIDQLGDDLEAVVDQLAADRPVVLVGHSLGGMTVLALAERAPQLFGSRVVGVALIATSAGRLSEVTLGLPKAAGLVLRRVRPRHLVGLSKGMPLLLALSRPRSLSRRGSVARPGDTTLSAAIVSSVVHRFSFGGTVDPDLVTDVETMIASTGIDVLAAFAPTFLDHDKLAALPTLTGVPTAVLVGDSDMMTPVAHSCAMAEALPDADLQVVPGAGHMVVTESPDAVAQALRRLLARVEAGRLMQSHDGHSDAWVRPAGF
ncbi:MAG TPA: alpha/beta hydrolase [Frankiaceae bacterium]|nr:alpha/beta hydrolase [Frankiaceae bacterium]